MARSYSVSHPRRRARILIKITRCKHANICVVSVTLSDDDKKRLVARTEQGTVHVPFEAVEIHLALADAAA